MNNIEIKRKLWGRRVRRECFHCGVRMLFEEATVDHYIPKAVGGGKGVRNAVLSCSPCNKQKADMLPQDFILKKAGLK